MRISFNMLPEEGGKKQCATHGSMIIYWARKE